MRVYSSVLLGTRCCYRAYAVVLLVCNRSDASDRDVHNRSVIVTCCIHIVPACVVVATAGLLICMVWLQQVCSYSWSTTGESKVDKGGNGFSELLHVS